MPPGAAFVLILSNRSPTHLQCLHQTSCRRIRFPSNCVYLFIAHTPIRAILENDSEGLAPTPRLTPPLMAPRATTRRERDNDFSAVGRIGRCARCLRDALKNPADHDADERVSLSHKVE